LNCPPPEIRFIGTPAIMVNRIIVNKVTAIFFLKAMRRTHESSETNQGNMLNTNNAIPVTKQATESNNNASVYLNSLF
jgi:hypothetical protein